MKEENLLNEITDNRCGIYHYWYGQPYDGYV